jgi:hypothetical protein
MKILYIQGESTQLANGEQVEDQQRVVYTQRISNGRSDPVCVTIRTTGDGHESI